jgi:hypothetical protein
MDEYLSLAASMISTPLAASTSIVLAQAGTESTWVSIPRKQAINGLRLAVITNSLADSQNMPFVESAFKGGPTMPRGAKRDLLFRQ